MSSAESRIAVSKEVRRAVFVPGDGIGPEVAWNARRVVEAAGADISWEEVRIGHDLFVQTGRAVPDQALKVLRKIPVVLKGPVEGAGSGIARNPNLEINEALNVFASVRRCRFLEGTPSPWHGFDVMIVKREGKGSIYPCDIKSAVRTGEAGDGGTGLERGASDIRIVTRQDLYRFIDFWVTYAMRTGRKRMCVAHKKNAA